MQQKCTKFSERLTELRERANLSRQQLADVLGVSRASLEYYEKGKRTPDIDVLYKLSEYFNVTSDYLIGRTNKSGESTDANAICEYTGLSEKSVKILRDVKTYPEYLKIINFIIEETEYNKGEYMVRYNDSLIEKLYSYFFYDYGVRNKQDDALYVSSLGHIFTSMEQYNNDKMNGFVNLNIKKDLSELKITRIPKAEVLDSVYINGITKQLEISKERFKELNNGND